MSLYKIFAGPKSKPGSYTPTPSGNLIVPQRGGLYLCSELPAPITDSTGNNKTGTITGTVTSGAGAFGDKAAVLNGSTGYFSIPLDGMNRVRNPANGLTMWAWVNLTTLTNPGAIFSKGANSGNTGFLFGLQTGKITFVTIQSSNNGAISSTSLPLTAGVWALVAFSWTGASLTSTTTPVQIYVNGVPLATTNTQTGSGSQTDVDTFPLLVGNTSWPTDSTGVDGLPVNFLHGSIDHFGWDYRVYGAAEHRDLYMRPFRMFASSNTLEDAILAYKISGGGTAYTMTASEGAFTMTGESATLMAARYLLAAAGVFTMTGDSAAFVYARKMIVSAGSFAMTGLSSAFVYCRKMIDSVGPFTMTGA